MDDLNIGLLNEFSRVDRQHHQIKANHINQKKTADQQIRELIDKIL